MRDRRAVEAHEGCRVAHARTHDGFGDALLARPALAGDQHRHITRGAEFVSASPDFEDLFLAELERSRLRHVHKDAAKVA